MENFVAFIFSAECSGKNFIFSLDKKKNIIFITQSTQTIERGRGLFCFRETARKQQTHLSISLSAREMESKLFLFLFHFSEEK